LIEKYLSDERWALVDSHLPGKPGDPGCSGRDNRLFLEAVLWIARTGSPWRNLPQEFGKWYTAYTRYRRWTKKGVWPRVFAALAQDQSCEFGFDDGDIRWTPLRAIVTRENGAVAETEEASRAAA